MRGIKKISKLELDGCALRVEAKQLNFLISSKPILWVSWISIRNHYVASASGPPRSSSNCGLLIGHPSPPNNKGPRCGPLLFGGEGGIRTPGPIAWSADFESAAFDHSATSPNSLQPSGDASHHRSPDWMRRFYYRLTPAGRTACVQLRLRKVVESAAFDHSATSPCLVINQ